MTWRGVSARLRRWGKIGGFVAAAGWLGVLLMVMGGASCGDGGFFSYEVTPTPTSTSTATPSATLGFVYVTNHADGLLSIFSRDLTTGALTLIGTTPAGAAPGPKGLALSPSKNFLYVANASDATIREFSVNLTDGSLTGIGSVNDGAGTSPQQIAIDPSGSVLYVTNGTGASISQYKVASDGTLSSNGTFSGAGLAQPIGIAAAPGGGAIYVADFSAGTVSSFAILSDGSLQLIDSVNSLGTTPGQPRLVAVDPSGDFVYATDASGMVSVFSVGAGNTLDFNASYLTAGVSNQPFDLALANNAAGLFLYTTNRIINTVSGFTVSGGVLKLQGSASGLATPAGIVSDPSGSFVYLANRSSGQIIGYSVGADGALSQIGAFYTESPANGASQPLFLAITD